MKTRSKILKAQFVHAMTKNRYMGNHPRTKRFILGSFATLVIGYVGFTMSLNLPQVSFKWSSDQIVIENRAQAKFEASDAIVEVKELTIEEKIAKTFPENPEIMIAVFKAESGLNPMAFHKNTNGTVDLGIAQINSVHKEDDLSMFDVDKNLAAARKIYDKQGIMAWYGFSNGGYLKYMK